MVIAFCTSCMNRRWQLEHTLPQNLAVLRGTPHFLALCDYNSGDDLGGLVRERQPFLDDGTLLYFRTDDPQQFHASLAKNTAHRLALRRRPDVLFNLDADNYLTPNTLTVVESTFAANPDHCLHQWSTDWHDGSFGRIALAARHWVHLGGYDEALHGMAWQDIDLLVRCRAAGLRYVLRSEQVPRPVPNDFEQRMAHVRVPPHLRQASAEDTYYRMHRENFTTMLGRPVTLAFENQRRFPGTLNFVEETVV